VRKALAYEVDGTPYVNIHNEVKVIKAEGVSVTVENLEVELLLTFYALDL
jgi:hypothetical protein